MQGEEIPILETRIIDDNSSWSSLSDTEKDVEEPKPLVKQAPQPQAPVVVESSEERLARFNIKESDIHSLYCVGHIHATAHNDIVVQPGKDLLNIDNTLFMKIGDKPVVLGLIEDVFGSIESPLYCVKIDDYLRQLQPHLESQGEEVKVYVIKDNAIFLDDAEIQSMRMETGTDACFQSERDHDSSGDESEIACARSQHDGFSKRNKSPHEFRNFNKKVKQNPYVFDNINQHNQYQLYPQPNNQPTPGNMLLNYLQHGRQQLPQFDMGYGNVQYPAPHFPQYNQYPQYPQYPPQHINQQQHQWPQPGQATQLPPQHQPPQHNQPQGSNNLNSFFYQ